MYRQTPPPPRNDTLLEIATFLARRWSGLGGVTVEFAEKGQPRTRLGEKRISLLPPGRYRGSAFQRYRQFRTSLWYESVRLAHCDRILSNDHAFGFILNTIETRRAEGLGRETWRGMDKELMFSYAYALNYRPPLGSLYGRARIVEAFYQTFMFGGIKGEIQPGHLDRVRRAAGLADGILKEAAENGRRTDWVEKQVPGIIRVLDIDSLLTVPVSLPWMRQGMALSEEEILRNLVKISKNREGDFGRTDPAAALQGKEVYDEYRVLVDEDRKNENRGLGTETVGLQTPPADGVDETAIYDPELINRLKTKFKHWRSGWREQHMRAGDEFDEESHIDGAEPFFTDVKRTIKTKIVILLDHSSSIYSEQTEYKKATLALCEVLSYLKVGFSVYAFSTQDRAVVCWLVKPENARWGHVPAKRLARIVANGATPLAEVYDKMSPIVQAGRPEILLTLTDGEPSDPGAVRAMIKSLKTAGIQMVALGLGPDTVRATMIANNLRTLGYERALAVSRLADIPNRVLGILERV